MIPKVIHYCWLSDDPFPEEIKRCIDSWKKYMPEYTIKRWSKDNFDINSVPLVKEAYEAKKYAFAADYIRCYALYTEGGIYLDSDVLVFKSFEKLLHEANYVTGLEYTPVPRLKKEQIDKNGHRKQNVESVFGIGIQAAFMASIPGHPFCKTCLERYNKLTLSELLLAKLTAPILQVKEMEPYGFVYDNIKQELSNGIIIYPTTIIGQSRNEIYGRFLTHLGAGSWVRKTFKSKMIKRLNKYGIYKLYIQVKDILGLLK